MKEVTQKRLDKARRAIRAAEALLATGDADFAASRAYYAMFYTAEALLGERGLAFRKHGAVHAAFGEHFARTGTFDPKFHRWLLAAFEQRIQSDYGIEATITPEDVRVLIGRAQEFLQAAQAYLQAGREH
jgi:uncharacterized protein (UPF0332 family)